MRMTVARVAYRYMLLTGCSVYQTAHDLTMVRRRVVNPESLSRSIATLVAENPLGNLVKLTSGDGVSLRPYARPRRRRVDMRPRKKAAPNAA